MAGAGEAHSLAVAADALLVEHVHIHFIEDKHILGLYGGIPEPWPDILPWCSGTPTGFVSHYLAEFSVITESIEGSAPYSFSRMKFYRHLSPDKGRS